MTVSVNTLHRNWPVRLGEANKNGQTKTYLVQNLQKIFLPKCRDPLMMRLAIHRTLGKSPPLV